MISVVNLKVEYGAFTLFSDVSFMISGRERVGLAGKNGAGKSTLLKIIAGLQEPSKGSIAKPNGLTIGYLPQHMLHKDNCTVIEEAKKAFANLNQLKIELEKATKEIEIRQDYESDDYMQLLEHFSWLNDQLQINEPGNIDGAIEQTLMGLGFTREDFTRSTREFSGGWRMRIELVKILLQKPELILLDEPTNHLDIQSIQWLEDFLKQYNGAIVLISHDKALLNNLTKRTLEINMAKIHDYDVPYSAYLIKRKERREQQMNAFRNQQKLIEKNEDFIERFRYKATKANQVQSRIKMLDKIDKIEIEDEDISHINIRFPAAPRSGAIAVEAKGMSKSYGQKKVLDSVDFILERGDKVAFVGKNGQGKSTFSKTIIKEIDYEGELRIGHNVNIGYFAQNQDELLDESKTVLETIEDIAFGDARTRVRDILGAFLFSGEDVDKKVKVLSGGERSRLAIAKLLLEPYNLLVLDEPTNHLDIRSKEILKQAIQKYDGSVVIVSHDRDFLDGLTQKIYDFDKGKIKEFNGTIIDYVNKFHFIASQKNDIKAKKQVIEAKPIENKQDYEERKNKEKEKRKLESSIKQTENRIKQFEADLKLIEIDLADPLKADQMHSLVSNYEQKKYELDKEFSNWEKFNFELEQFEQK